MSTSIPSQHGAWPFLALPFALGVVVVDTTPLLIPLAIAWVAAYPLSYAAFGLVRSRHPHRFRAPFLVWAAAVSPPAALLLFWRPWLMWFGFGYAALFAVNLGYARRNDERAVVNDLVFIVECAAMVVVIWAVGSGDRAWAPPSFAQVPARTWIMTAVCALMLSGSTLHVKSLIRERRDARFARASRTLAVVSLPVSVTLGAWWGWPGGVWLVAPFALLAVRAFVVPRLSLRPAAVGMVELAGFLTAVAAAASATV